MMRVFFQACQQEIEEKVAGATRSEQLWRLSEFSVMFEMRGGESRDSLGQTSNLV